MLSYCCSSQTSVQCCSTGLQLVLQTFALNSVRCTAGGGPAWKARKRIDSMWWEYNWGVLLLTVRSQIIQEPSMLQLTHSVSFLRTCLPPAPLESSWFVSPWFQRRITGFERPFGVRERETELLQLWLRQRQHGLSLRLSCYGFDSLFATPEPDSKNCSRQDHHEKASFQLQQKPAGFVSAHIQAFKFH